MQVRQNMMSMLHALLFPGSEPQASKPAQPAQAPQASGEPAVTLPSDDLAHQLKSGPMASKQPGPPPRRKAHGGLQPAPPKLGSNNPRAASPGLPGAALPDHPRPGRADGADHAEGLEHGLVLCLRRARHVSLRCLPT